MNIERKNIITFDRILLLGILAVQILLFVKYFTPLKPAVHTALPQEYGRAEGTIPPSQRPNPQMHTPATPSQPSHHRIRMKLPAPPANKGKEQIAVNPFDPFPADPFAGFPDDFNDMFQGNPFKNIRSMHQRMDRLMEDAVKEFEEIENLMHFDKGWNMLNSSPSVDMRDSGDNYVLTFSLPDIDPANIQITLDNRILTVKAEYNNSTGNSRSYRMFEKKVQLPGPVESDKVEKSTGANGLLRITVPKKTASGLNDENITS